MDPDFGYVKDNIEVISHKANFIKCRASLPKLNNFCLNHLQRFGCEVQMPVDFELMLPRY